MKFFRFWMPVILWMAVIFSFSARQKIPVSDSYVVSFLFFKTLHLLEYMALYTLTYRAFRNSLRHPGRAWVYAFFVVGMYALSDEYHQLFVPTREGRLRDAIIDMIGAGIAWISLKQLLPKIPKQLKTLAKQWQLL